MSIRGIEDLLQEVIGLNSESIGRNTVERVVRVRMEACVIEDSVVYFERVKTDPAELQALIDEITVPETWFFRDREPFAYLEEFVCQERLDALRTRKRALRILSVPCATGEEPYSIAMVMRDLGLKKEQVAIDAIDISTRALAHARKGIYRNNAFRGDEGDRKERYFHKVESGYMLDPAIREMVNIMHGNILEDTLLRTPGMYDVIFCRNLLIYFDRPLQMQAVAKLNRLLSDDGVLFVGHAEGGCLLEENLKSVKRPGAFAFRKRQFGPGQGRAAAVASPAPAIPVTVAPSVVLPVKARRRLTASPSSTPAGMRDDAGPAGSRTRPAELETAQRYADQGRLREAAAICVDYLASHPLATDAYCLLGLIREAEGDDRVADELFRKAVYLEPNNYQALVHLAVHAELRGDRDQAAALRTRAQRAATLDETRGRT